MRKEGASCCVTNGTYITLETRLTADVDLSIYYLLSFRIMLTFSLSQYWPICWTWLETYTIYRSNLKLMNRYHEINQRNNNCKIKSNSNELDSKETANHTTSKHIYLVTGWTWSDLTAILVWTWILTGTFEHFRALCITVGLNSAKRVYAVFLRIENNTN